VSHEPEHSAAEYLGGAMSARQARRFEAHLVECEECWREVAEGRRGRQVAEAARELAPPVLREDVRASLAMRPRRNPRPWIVRSAAGAVVVLALAISGVVVLRGPRQPGAIAEAVGDYRGARLAASGPAARPPPELTGAGLSLVAQGGGAVGALAVDAYAYRDNVGHRLLLYLSDHPFPVAAGAHHSSQPEGPWVGSDSGVEMLCASRPEAFLALSGDAALLRRVAAVLGVQGVPE